MEMVWAVIGGQRVFRALQGEASTADTVGKPAHQRTDVLILTDIVLQGVKAQQDIHKAAIPIRDPQRPDRAAVGEDIAGEPARPQGVLFHGPAVRQDAKGGFHCHTHVSVPFPPKGVFMISFTFRVDKCP